MELEDVAEAAVYISPESPPSPTLFCLPAEIVQHIVSFLSLQEVCKLGATCRHAHALTHDEAFWGLQVRRQFRLFFTANRDQISSAWEDIDSRRPPLEGVVCDPGIQGNREVCAESTHQETPRRESCRISCLLRRQFLHKHILLVLSNGSYTFIAAHRC